MKKFECDITEDFIDLERWDGNILRYSFSISRNINTVNSYVPDVTKFDYQEFIVVQKVVIQYSILLSIGIDIEKLESPDKIVIKELRNY